MEWILYVFLQHTRNIHCQLNICSGYFFVFWRLGALGLPLRRDCGRAHIFLQRQSTSCIVNISVTIGIQIRSPSTRHPSPTVILNQYCDWNSLAYESPWQTIHPIHTHARYLFFFVSQSFTICVGRSKHPPFILLVVPYFQSTQHQTTLVSQSQWWWNH